MKVIAMQSEEEILVTMTIAEMLKLSGFNRSDDFNRKFNVNIKYGVEIRDNQDLIDLQKVTIPVSEIFQILYRKVMGKLN